MKATVEPAVKAMPRGWLSFALLCWGGFTDAWASAIVMAAMVEAISVSPVKWALGAREFHRAADLTSVVFAIVTVVQFSRYSVHGIYQILTVAPYCFFPLLLAQRASTAQTIPMSALFYSLRRYPEHDRQLDVAPHYIVICILAASTVANRSPLFIVFSAILVIGLLAAGRPRRYRWWQWLASLCLALALAAGTQLGVLRAQSALEDSVMYWFNQFPWSPSDPNRAVTAIGAIGRLKLSDQIRVRVTPSPALRVPLTLHEASYDVFKYGSWSAHGAKFEALDKIANENAWDAAAPAPGATDALEITIQHRRDLTVLPLPRGTRRVQSGEIAELQRNRFGTLLAESPPGALRFTATGGEPRSIEPPPTAGDLEIPEDYRKLISGTAAEIGLDGASDSADAERIRRFFLDNFKYSLIQRGRYFNRTPLAHFLTETRRGHCEYFATAAVLLLREAGIPARYAVGYVVEDYSELEGAYIARARHAHAWALAYIDDRWERLDATPAVWFELENEYASRWQNLHDVASWLWFRYQRLSEADFSELTDYLIWLVPPLAIVLYLRLRKSPLAVRGREQEPVAADDYAGSPLRVLLESLRRRGLVAEPGETMAQFLRRSAPPVQAGVRLQDIIRAYYRERFSARPPDPQQTRELRRQIQRYNDESAR